jgi:CRP-like cAMP-binding protein
LKAENLSALARKTQLRELGAGRTLFKDGDTEKRTFYLVSGSVELRADDRLMGTVHAGSPEARAALAPGLPRKFTARAATDLEYIMIDSDLLDVLLTWDQTGQYEVSELNSGGVEATGDWMTTLLQTKAFHRIPPANIQAIFMRMQRINYRAGDVVIKQGTEGDYFYVVVAGKCIVTRETPLNKEGIKLAELGPGDSFGEEALIAEAKRNATVTMATDGTLMRLGKQDFQTLLNEPLLQWVTQDQAKEIVAKGGKWLDVRLPSEFQNFRIDGAVNIPLYFIRLKLNALDKDTPYIVCCDTGRRSSAAAYILSERGFEAYVLQGGLAATEAARTNRG